MSSAVSALARCWRLSLLLEFCTMLIHGGDFSNTLLGTKNICIYSGFSLLLVLNSRGRFRSRKRKVKRREKRAFEICFFSFFLVVLVNSRSSNTQTKQNFSITEIQQLAACISWVFIIFYFLSVYSLTIGCKECTKTF